MKTNRASDFALGTVFLYLKFKTETAARPFRDHSRLIFNKELLSFRECGGTRHEPHMCR